MNCGNMFCFNFGLHVDVLLLVLINFLEGLGPRLNIPIKVVWFIKTLIPQRIYTAKHVNSRV